MLTITESSDSASNNTHRAVPYVAPGAPDGHNIGRWQDDAACAGVDPDLWFPPGGTAHPRAIRICLACPVRVPCAEAGEDEDYGIWGGILRQPRRHQRWVRPPCGSANAYKWHVRHGEDACRPCLDAEQRRGAEQRARRERAS